MAIDASIYSNIQNPAANMVSPLDQAQKAMSLSQLGMQQAQMGYQMKTQQAMRAAAAQNTDPQTGQLNRAGYVSTLSKLGLPMEAQGELARFDQMDKQTAEAQNAKAQAVHGILSVTTPAMQHLLSLPDDQAAKAFPNVMNQLKAQGIPMQNVPPAWDRGWAQQTYDIGSKMLEGRENQLKQAQVGNTQAQTAKTYADVGQVGDKYLQAFKDDLDPNKARGGNLAKNQAVVDAADRLNAMFKQFPDYNIPKAQQTELVSAFGSLLNGGSSPFVSQLEELIPKSARGDANAMASWVLNQPQGAQQQKFMALLHDSVNRERDVADMKVKTAQVQRVSSHQQLFKSNPGGAYAVLHSYGIEPENIQNGKYVPSQQQQDDNGAPVGNQTGPLASNRKSSDLIQSANAGQNQPKLTGSDAAALQWVLNPKNASTPEAFKIRAKLKAKGYTFK